MTSTPSGSREVTLVVPGGRVPSLDGLRALSIAFVLVSHSFFMYGQTHDQDWLYVVRLLGPLGVGIFFVISGFIITTLLNEDRHRKGRIDLPQFYVRRAFRILPAFLCYVALVAVLGPPLPVGAVRNSLLFVANYLPTGWWLGHTWSLSIEEQFYVLWPATMALAGISSSRVAAWVVLVSPLVRVVHHLAFPTDSVEPYLHTRLDALMVGCFIALERGRLGGSLLFRLTSRGDVAAVLTTLAVVASPLLARRFAGLYVFPFKYTLEAVAAGSLLLWSVQNPRSLVGRLLNWRPVMRLGVLSYSLYLWQQPFFSAELSGTWAGTFPFNILLPIALAELSHRFVEKPSLRLRDRAIARLHNWRGARGMSDTA